MLWLVITVVLNILANVLLKKASFANLGLTLKVENLAGLAWLAGACLTYMAAFIAYSMAVRTLPLAIAYVSIVGITAAGIALIGWRVWGEALRPSQIVAFAMILVGISLLNRA